MSKITCNAGNSDEYDEFTVNLRKIQGIPRLFGFEAAPNAGLSCWWSLLPGEFGHRGMAPKSGGRMDTFHV